MSHIISSHDINHEIFDSRLLLFIGLAVTVLSAPIPSKVADVSDMERALEFCALVILLTFGTAALSYSIEGAINNHNNHKAIDHYFQELRK